MTRAYYAHDYTSMNYQHRRCTRGAYTHAGRPECRPECKTVCNATQPNAEGRDGHESAAGLEHTARRTDPNGRTPCGQRFVTPPRATTRVRRPCTSRVRITTLRFCLLGRSLFILLVFFFFFSFCALNRRILYTSAPHHSVVDRLHDSCVRARGSCRAI